MENIKLVHIPRLKIDEEALKCAAFILFTERGEAKI